MSYRAKHLFEKLSIVQPLKNFPAFYETRRFITVSTRALQWSLSWARSFHSGPSHFVSLRSILILSTHLRLGLPSGVYSSGFQTNNLYPHSCYISCQSHPPSLDHSNYIWRGVKVMKLLIMQFSQISRHFISFRTKYSPQTPSLCVPPLMSETKFRTHT
jgi:hypothetical protein